MTMATGNWKWAIGDGAKGRVVKDLVGLAIAVSLAFFVLSGAGIFSFWFWLLIF